MRRRSIYLSFLVFIAVLGSVASSFAQNIADHNWYFGNTARAIRFSRSTNLPTLLNNKAPLNLGGTAVATDQINGNLLFYTDGVSVFNYANVQMPNGSGLAGNNTQNQPVAISKVPGATGQFYIFHRSAGGAVTRTTVDMTIPGGAAPSSPPLGDVVAAAKNIALSPVALTGKSEAMITIPHANGNDFWLITHQNGFNIYSVTLVTTGGTFTQLPDVFAGSILSAANFSYHKGTGRIAVSPKERLRNVEILSFDNTSGAIAFVTEVANSGTTSINSGDAIYDTEWSNTGQYLYISRHGDPAPPTAIQADVLQFDTRNPSTTLASVLPQPNTIARSYGLQMAPDSSVYHLYQATAGGPFFLGALTDPDTTATLTAYVPQAFPGNINFQAKQFPSFAADVIDAVTVDFTAAGFCQNGPTTFYPTVLPGADSIRWDFGDGGPPESSWSPVHTYQNAGAMPVTMTAFLNGQVLGTKTNNITINAFTLQITLQQEDVACTCELQISHSPGPYPHGGPGTCTQYTIDAQINGSATSMQWFGPNGPLTGQTTATLTPPEAGYYYLVATDGTGCSTYAGITIREYQVQTNRTNIWYFGDNAGLDFNPPFLNPPGPIGTPTAPYDTPEGTSVISDLNGQVIVSTDGREAFDRNGTNITPAPNPPGLGGDPGSTQSALIVPVPGDETLFYIFTTKEVYGTGTYELRYSLFDHKLNNGLGAISRANELLLSNSTERITSDGNWLIAHEYGNNSFRAYRITPQGIGNPVISSIGSDHSFTIEANGQGYMEFGGNSQIVVALSNPGVSNTLEIFDFDVATGIVSNFKFANLKENNGQVYGVEFAGNKILASVKTPTSSKIIEVFFDAQNVPHTVRATPITEAVEFGSIQTGPNGTVYVAINGSKFLGTILVNGDTLQASTVVLNGQTLGGTNESNLGLPNFVQQTGSPISGPAVVASNACIGNPITFTGTPTDIIDTFEFRIRDSSNKTVYYEDTDTNNTLTYTLTSPGNYEVTMYLSNKCAGPQFDSVKFAFTVFPNPPLPVPGTQVVCTGPVTLSAYPVNDPTMTYAWSSGQTTNSITVSQPGQYDVTVTSAQGCVSTGSGFVTNRQPVIDLGSPLTTCQNVAVGPLDAQNPQGGNTYSWTINGGAPIGTGQTQAVSTTVPGVFTYQVTVTTPSTPTVPSCSATASTTITINPTPTFTLDHIDPACGSNNGQITIHFNTPPGGIFAWNIFGPTVADSFSGTGQSQGVDFSTPMTLSAGSYLVHVEDQVSTCAPLDQPQALSNPTFTATFDDGTGCDPNITINVTHTVPAASPLTYILRNAATQAIVAQDLNPTVRPSPFQISGLTAGPGFVLTIMAGGCSFTTGSLPINQDPLATATSVVDGCTNPMTITMTDVTAGNSYSWTGPGITGSRTGAVLSVQDPPQGNQVYTVTISAPGFCDNPVQIPVNINNNVTVAVAQDDVCVTQGNLIASVTPAGTNYLYNWFEKLPGDPGFTGIGGGSQIPITVDQAQYYVEVVKTTSACPPVTSAVTTVDLPGPIVITALNFPTPIPCEGENFVLTSSVNNPNVTYTWSFNGVSIPGQSGLNRSTLTDNRAGVYSLDVAFATCTDHENITITPNQPSPGQLSDLATICPDLANPNPTTRQITLDAGPGFTAYQWFRDGVTLPGETNQTILVDDETEVGLYTVDLTNTFGCHSTDQTQVDIDCPPKIIVPSAFRPASEVEVNGELVNREFQVLSFFIDETDFQVFVFNRWGEMIYQSNDRDFKWNGGYNNTGQLLPAGTYSYVIRYKAAYRPEEGIKEKRGGVVLVR